jgi:hypothetical protein
MPNPLPVPPRPVVVAMALIVVAVVFASGAGEVILAPLGLDALDRTARETVRGVMVRAGAAFAISKTINAALSIAQEITLSASVFVGASVNPARFLEPVNNLVDQFALVMLLAAAAAAAIEILLALGTAVGARLILPLALVLLALSQLLPAPRPAAARLARLGASAMLLALVVRLVLPLALAMTGALSDRFLEERYTRATAGIEQVERRAEDAAGQAAADPSLFQQSREWTESIWRTTSLIGESFDSLFEDVVTLVTVFLLETVLLPLAILWLGYRALLVLIAPAAGTGARDLAPAARTERRTDW